MSNDGRSAAKTIIRFFVALRQSQFFSAVQSGNFQKTSTPFATETR
jgi:hypothetical protein